MSSGHRSSRTRKSYLLHCTCLCHSSFCYRYCLCTPALRVDTHVRSCCFPIWSTSYTIVVVINNRHEIVSACVRPLFVIDLRFGIIRTTRRGLDKQIGRISDVWSRSVGGRVQLAHTNSLTHHAHMNGCCLHLLIDVRVCRNNCVCVCAYANGEYIECGHSICRTSDIYLFECGFAFAVSMCTRDICGRWPVDNYTVVLWRVCWSLQCSLRTTMYYFNSTVVPVASELVLYCCIDDATSQCIVIHPAERSLCRVLLLNYSFDFYIYIFIFHI